MMHKTYNYNNGTKKNGTERQTMMHKTYNYNNGTKKNGTETNNDAQNIQL
jgi:hypothetical protein